MAEINVKSSKPKLVQVGRVLVFVNGPHKDKIAVIVEIIDFKRALVDAPTIRGEGGLPRAPRHAASLQDTKLTSIVMDKLPRGIGTGKLAKKWEAQGIEEKWKATSWYKKSQAMEKRRNMTDFDRFVAMKLKKQARFEQRKALAGVRKEEKS